MYVSEVNPVVPELVIVLERLSVLVKVNLFLLLNS